MTIEGRTNVLSSRFGSGCASDLSRACGRFVAATMEIPWRLARERIGGKPEAVLFADSMEIDEVDAMVRAAPPCDTVLAVGGGRLACEPPFPINQCAVQPPSTKSVAPVT